jgi:hypothetical protein
MPPKKSRKSVRSHVMRGGNFFNDVGNFFTKTIPGAAKTVYNKALKPVYNKALKPAGNWIKDQKVISKVGNALGSVLPGPAGTAAKAVGGVAGAVGLGKRRRTRKSHIMRGGAVRGASSKVRF